jgi:hypothetical protein
VTFPRVDVQAPIHFAVLHENRRKIQKRHVPPTGVIRREHLIDLGVGRGFPRFIRQIAGENSQHQDFNPRQLEQNRVHDALNALPDLLGNLRQSDRVVGADGNDRRLGA